MTVRSFPVAAGVYMAVGLSSDTKPAAMNGSLYIESDTGRFYNRESEAWVEKLHPGYESVGAAAAAVAALVNSSPAALDTLKELSDALGADPNFATTITNALALKLASASYTAADVLAKLLTVDGTGSGLDAERLGGALPAAFDSAGAAAAAQAASQPLSVNLTATAALPPYAARFLRAG